MMNWFYDFNSIFVLIGFIFVAGVVFINLKKTQNTMTDEEKIALTKRLLENLTSIALFLVTQAEIAYGGNAGKLKRAWVIDQLYARIPDQFKAYITTENLNTILEMALATAKSMWEENKNLLQKY